MMQETEYSKTISLEHRKKFAQFFTPNEIAKIMADWLLLHPELKTILEPAFGLGIFSRFLLRKKNNLQIKGFEVDPIIFSKAIELFNTEPTVKIQLNDYLFTDWHNKYDGIICNPPYFKFHDYENKKSLLEIKKKLKVQLNGFTNIYTLFLLKAIHQLEQNGRAAFVIPSEFMNSDYGRIVKEKLLQTDTLAHVIILDFKEKLFDALTTTSILLLRKDNNSKKINFIKLNNKQQLKKLTLNLCSVLKSSGKSLNKACIDPNVKWKSYYQKSESSNYKNLIPFSNVAKVVRGIATGANEYFTFNAEKVRKYDIPDSCLMPCITKSKDVSQPFFTDSHFKQLESQNAKVYLLNAEIEPHNKNIEKYIQSGIEAEINKRYLTSKRNPWFSVENRPPSPIWVSVFNRKNIKFVRNEAEIYNLTTFHCVYLNSNLFNSIDTDLLFAYLLTDTAKSIFSDNSREYGNGLNKFEPNDLNRGLILDLSLLSIEEKKLVKDKAIKYRASLLIGDEKKEHILEIEHILNSRFRI